MKLRNLQLNVYKKNKCFLLRSVHFYHVFNHGKIYIKITVQQIYDQQIQIQQIQIPILEPITSTKYFTATTLWMFIYRNLLQKFTRVRTTTTVRFARRFASENLIQPYEKWRRRSTKNKAAVVNQIEVARKYTQPTLCGMLRLANKFRDCRPLIIE